MSRPVTIIAKGVIFLCAIAVLAVCGILLPELAREEAVGKANPPTSWPFLVGAWIFSLPIFVALYQAWKILRNIDRNDVFSLSSIKALKTIKICAFIFSTLIVISAVAVIVIVKSVDPTEDVTPVVPSGIIFALVPFVIATAAAVLQRLLQQAIDIKSQNDLTV